MSDPITITVDAGWLSRAWSCVPKTKADFYALPGKIAGKIANSVMWAVYHTQVWLALAVAFVAGAALSPLARPHLARYDVPMVEAENVAPRPINIDLRGVQQQLDVVQAELKVIKGTIADTSTRVVATQGSVAQIQDFTQHVPEMMSGMFVLGAAQSPPPAAAPVAKPKPQPVAKKPPTPAPEAPKPAPTPAPEASPLDIIKGWVK